MIPDSEGLHEIANTTSPDRKADIVFVHGLGGASHSTWRHGKEGKAEHFFWPDDLGKDLPECGIWTVGYPAGITALGKPGMIIEKRAGNLSLKLANAGFGDRPLLFITHSMGGLVVKSLIVDSQTLADADRKRIANVFRGIVFCATPHRGSAFADAACVLGKFFGGSQSHVDEMRSNAEPLDILHDGFIEWHKNHPVPIESYAENIGLFRKRWWWRPLPLGLVVPRTSANPGIAGYTIHDVDEDHLTIVKPSSRNHDVYAGVLRFISSSLAITPRSKTSVSAAVATQIHTFAKTAPAKTIGTPVYISCLDKYAPVELVGRETELKLLNDAWDKALRGDKPRPHILTFVALGGEGKTSLVAKWAADLVHQGWPGCDAVFAWSFYSQGTREQVAASSDNFLREALVFFGDAEIAGSARHASDKGSRLAQLVGQRRALLILDGLEPLQYAPGPPMDGKLKDDGLIALLKGLAASSLGLCIVTTRYSIPDLKAYWQSTAPEVTLPRLSTKAGGVLLRSLGVLGAPQEFKKLVEDVKGHALTLNLLGFWLYSVHAGDIRKRDLVKLEEAGADVQGGHAFHVMDSYVKWLESEGERGKSALAILRLIGLFDRPATSSCLNALLVAPAISNLTETLVGMSEAERNVAIARLEAARLLTVNRDASRKLIFIDAHPLIREYFSKRLREQQPEAWRAAHRRLYEHLCAFTLDKPQPTLEDLQPLYQAVAHGCQAGLQQEACDKVYSARIQRGDERYSTFILGALGADLEALACFFETPWSRISPKLTEATQAWLLNEAAFRLRALGRLTEALEPMRTTLEFNTTKSWWKNASVCAGNLSELELTLGEVAGAVRDAEQCVTYADRSGDAFRKIACRCKIANALHEAGRRAEAKKRFWEAEQMQAEYDPEHKLLYSLRGFLYCDLLLTEVERAAWQLTLNSSFLPHSSSLCESCRAVSERAAKMFKWRIPRDPLLDIALDHLTLGSAKLYAAILSRAELPLDPNTKDAQQRVATDDKLSGASRELDAAVAGLRRAGTLHHIPRSLLTRAWLRSLTGVRTGPESAQSDLDEAWEIAERGPMKLFMADIHLYRARIFFREEKYPWESPAVNLAAAEKLVNECGYHRRDEELADAKKAILGK